MIEYEALMEMHLFNMQLEKDDENGKPEFATMTIPANKMYETAGTKITKNYSRLLDMSVRTDALLGLRIYSQDVSVSISAPVPVRTNTYIRDSTRTNKSWSRQRNLD